jgi:hypothetical protein
MCGESEVGGGCGVEIFVVEVLASTSAGDSGQKVPFTSDPLAMELCLTPLTPSSRSSSNKPHKMLSRNLRRALLDTRWPLPPTFLLPWTAGLTTVSNTAEPTSDLPPPTIRRHASRSIQEIQHPKPSNTSKTLLNPPPPHQSPSPHPSASSSQSSKRNHNTTSQSTSTENPILSHKATQSAYPSSCTMSSREILYA